MEIQDNPRRCKHGRRKDGKCRKTKRNDWPGAPIRHRRAGRLGHKRHARFGHGAWHVPLRQKHCR